MNKASKILLAIGGSIAVGTALGVLFAPEEGSETRKKLLKRSRKLAGIVEENIDEGRESLEEIRGVLEKQLHRINRRMEQHKC